MWNRTYAELKSNTLAKARVFWLTMHDDSTFADVLHALYYLPENYKLMVRSDALDQSIMADMEHTAIAKRVRFVGETGLSEKTSPFSFADAIIYGNDSSQAEANAKPAVVVTKNTSKDIEDNQWGGYTVSIGKPEAIATAVLRISRATV